MRRMKGVEWVCVGGRVGDVVKELVLKGTGGGGEAQLREREEGVREAARERNGCAGESLKEK